MNKTLNFICFLCTICAEPSIVAGDEKFGGVRYCYQCLTQSILWKTFSFDDQMKIFETFSRLEKDRSLKKTFRNLKKSSDSERKQYIRMEEFTRNKKMKDV